VIALDRGELRYADQRKLRGVWLAGDDDEAAHRGAAWLRAVIAAVADAGAR
jgi:hypothetical protein